MGFFSPGKTRCSLCLTDVDGVLLETPDRKKICKQCAERLREDQRRKSIQPKIREIRRRLQKDPSDAETHYVLGKALIPNGLHSYRGYPVRRSDVREGCESLVEALKTGLSDPVQRGHTYYILGVCVQWLIDNNVFDADYLEPFGIAAPHHADDPKPYVELMDLAKGYFYLAEKEFSLVLGYEPDNEEILTKLKSAYGRLGNHRKCEKLRIRLQEVQARKSIGQALTNEIRKLSPQEKGLAFESKCMNWLRAEDFSVQSTSVTGDGGVDIVAVCSKPIVGGTYVVQCKNWSKPVDEPTVRDLCGVVEKWKAVKGIIISKSGFTSSAQTFAKGMRLELINGHQLDQLLSLATKKG